MEFRLALPGIGADLGELLLNLGNHINSYGRHQFLPEGLLDQECDSLASLDLGLDPVHAEEDVLFGCIWLQLEHIDFLRRHNLFFYMTRGNKLFITLSTSAVLWIILLFTTEDYTQ